MSFRRVLTYILTLVTVSCGTVKKPPSVPMEEWSGKNREEVKAAFSHLTPKTEENRITYRDTDPIPSPARCAVVPCYPWFPGRINCTYVFKFKDDRVVSATRSGNCREKKDYSER